MTRTVWKTNMATCLENKHTFQIRCTVRGPRHSKFVPSDQLNHSHCLYQANKMWKLFDSVTQLKLWGLPNVGQEGSVCNYSPTPVCAATHFTALPHHEDDYSWMGLLFHKDVYSWMSLPHHEDVYGWMSLPHHEDVHGWMSLPHHEDYCNWK